MFTDLWNSFSNYLVNNAPDLAFQAFVAALVIAAFYLLARIAAATVSRALKRTDQGILLSDLVSTAVKYVIIAFGVIMGLDQLGFDITTVLAGAGVAGVAIGFGAQSLVKDTINGFFIIMTGVMEKGDYVEVLGGEGTVEEVTLRQTRVRSITGELWYIPNGKIDVVVNHNRGWKKARAEVGLAYEQDVGRGLEVLDEIGKEWAAANDDLVLDEPESQGVLNLGDSSVGVRLQVKVAASGPVQNRIERELTRLIKDRFDEEGIEIPFPRQVLYHRTEGSEETAGIAVIDSDKSADSSGSSPEDQEQKAA